MTPDRIAPEIEDLLAEYVERRESGERLAPEAFCAEHPEVGDSLELALRKLADTESLFPDGLETPAEIGPFEVLGTLGRGGLGAVHRARDRRSGETVALKLLHVTALLDPRARERFRREGETLRRIAHPNVVKVREVGIESGQPYLAMDLVEGRSLADIVADARDGGDATTGRWESLAIPGDGPAIARVATIVARLARAVATLHSQGILHRDLKPHNVIVRAPGDPVLVDFGLAGDDDLETLTRSGDVVGTIPYMAPEQARGERVDEAADVYGLGAILHELLTLAPPHPGSDSVSLLHAVTVLGPGRIERLDRAIPPALATVVYRCLAFSPWRRYPTAAAVAEDLEAFLEGRSVVGPGPRAIERVGDVWRRNGTAARVALTVAVCALAIVIAGVVAGRRLGQDREFHETRRDAALAWLERDREEFDSHVERLEALRPADGATRFFVAAGDAEADPRELGPGWRSLLEGIQLRRAKQPGSAIDALEVARRQLSDSALPLAELGRAARNAGDLSRAVRELSAALGLAPTSARLHYELGRALYESDDMEAALAPARRATELEADSARYWTQLARVCCRTRRFEEGLTAARVAAEKSGEPEKDVLRSLAVLLDSTGEHEEALEVFEELYRLDPESRNTCFSMALVHDNLDHHLEAIRFYRETITGHPDECQARICLASIHAGANRAKCAKCETFFREHPEYDDPDRAEHLCREALAIDGGRDPDVLNAMIGVLQKIDRLRPFLAELERARDAAEEDGAIVNLQRAIRRVGELLEQQP